MPPHTEFHFERLSHIKLCLIYFQTPWPIFRMDSFSPANALFLSQCSTGKLKPSTIDEIAMFGRVRGPNHDGRRIRDRAKSMFTLTQRVFDPSLLLGEDRHEIKRRPCEEEHVAKNQDIARL